MAEEKKQERIKLNGVVAGPKPGLELWFHDSVEISQGCRLSIKVKDVLCHYKSEFQEIAIFETEKMGRMLVLDNTVMLAEFDESAYHEMIVHVPLMVHPEPRRVLVIGGGDGGTVREVLKHPEVEQVDLCEIDGEVVKACRRFLPSLAFSLDHPKVKIFYEDGARFIRKKPGAYDIIIVDSTDPVGPGQILFQAPFYEDMKTALTGEGIAVTQCESFYFHRHVIEGVASFARKIFPLTHYYYTLVPTYPSGVIGFLFCSMKYDPLRDLSEGKASAIEGLNYYTPELHRASFTLPHFAKALFGK